MKVKDFIRPFLSKKVFETTVCITVDNEDLIFNVGDTLTDSQFIKDLENKTVKHSSVCKDVLFIEIKVFPKSIQAFINLLNKLSKNDVYYLKA